MTELPLNRGTPHLISTQGTPARAPIKINSLPTEAVLDTSGVGVRAPSHNEGALLWEIADEVENLDLNSPYAYMEACRNFQNTCAIAEVYGETVGFVMAHRIPTRMDVLFIWQVAVLPETQGLGIAKRMFNAILEREDNAGIRTVEATVTPSNKASANLFKSFAKERQASLNVHPGFAVDDFPDGYAHEPEDLFVISPIASIAKSLEGAHLYENL